MILDSAENKCKILENFLKIAAFEGWSEATLIKAFELSQIDPKFKNLIFEAGCLDLIEFYISRQNQKLLDKIATTPDFTSFKVREKIKFSLYVVFENEAANQLALQRLQNFYLDLRNFTKISQGARPLLMAMKHVGKLADAIWSAIGDKSTDFNFYTKRLTLSKIILQSFFVFVKDNSANLEKTKKFIDLQIEKVMKFEKFKSQIRNFSSKIKENSQHLFCDEQGNAKSPKQILRDLPFVRLFKF